MRQYLDLLQKLLDVVVRQGERLADDKGKAPIAARSEAWSHEPQVERCLAGELVLTRGIRVAMPATRTRVHAAAFDLPFADR